MTYPTQAVETKITEAMENGRPVVLSRSEAQRLITALTQLRNQTVDPKLEPLRMQYNNTIDWLYGQLDERWRVPVRDVIQRLEGLVE